MTKETFYKKVGRRYVPVREYDVDLRDSYPHGAHLVVVKPYSRLTVHNVDPEWAGLAAAGTVARDVISKEIRRATDMRLYSKTPITEQQRDAWQALNAAFGDDIHLLEWPSAYEAAGAAVTALENEFKEALKIPAVKLAYEQFLMVYKLTKDDVK